MSYRRRQAALAHAMATARTPEPSPWGRGIEPGAQVTTFGRHGIGMPAIDGEVIDVDGEIVTILCRDTGLGRIRTINNVRKAGTHS